MDKWSLEMPSQWELRQDIQERVLKSLASAATELRDAASMVATELIENAIKYGRSTPPCPMIRVAFSVDDRGVVIEVRNGMVDLDRVRDLIQGVEAIERAPDKMSLYEGRLRELKESGLQGTSVGLGLYRVAAEGGFHLSGQFADETLHLTATRRTQGAEQ